MCRPKLTLDLEPKLEAFLRYCFNAQHNQPIVVSKAHYLGYLIHSKVGRSENKVAELNLKNPVSIEITQDNATLFSNMKRYLYFDRAALSQIKDAIEWEYYHWIVTRFEMGYEERFQRQEIIETMMNLLDAENYGITFESIKKYDYRNRQRRQERRFKKALKALQ